MSHTTLVSAGELRSELENPNWRVVDCRFNLAEPDWGEAAYRDGHIPSARYAHLDRDLSGPVAPDRGRHPLPDPDRLAERFGRWGIGPDTRVVAYDQGSGGFAVRLWWLLRWLGHEQVAVLDGGIARWQRLGYPLAADPPCVQAMTFVAAPRPEMLVSTADLMSPAFHSLMLDAREAPRFRGVEEPIDPVAGRIPGACNRPFAHNLQEAGVFRSPADLAADYRALLKDTPPGDVVHYCGSGVTACHNLLAMERAGLTGSRLYAGSWSEWILDPRRPVARDAR